VKDRDDLRPGIPVGDVIRNQLQVKDRRRQVPFECQVRDAEGDSKFTQSNWDVDVKWFR
jgi:hypothetical protein